VCPSLPALKKFSEAESQSGQLIFLWRLWTVLLLTSWGERTQVVSHLAHMTFVWSALDTAPFVVEQPETSAVAATQTQKKCLTWFSVTPSVS